MVDLRRLNTHRKGNSQAKKSIERKIKNPVFEAALLYTVREGRSELLIVVM